jgi:hypothetical protein
MMVLFSALTLHSLYRLFRGARAFVLDAHGMVDDTNNFFVGAIPWSEVRAAHALGKSVSLKGVPITSATFVVIDVRDPGRFVPRRNRFQRLMRAINTSTTGGAITLNVSAMNVSAEELAETINRCAAQYQAMKS